MAITRAIILAGGLGERLKPLTDTTPKPLLPIRGKPIIQHAIENLRQYGINEIILSVGYKADLIQAYFGDGRKFGVHISYSVEKQPLGTGGAIKLANGSNQDPFILLWGDNVSDININHLVSNYSEKCPITMTLVKRADVEHFGVAKMEGNLIVGFVEKPAREKAPSNLINAGAFVVSPSVLSMLPEGKSSIEKQCFEKLAPERKVRGFLHTGYWFPTDTLEKYRYAEEHLPR